MIKIKSIDPASKAAQTLIEMLDAYQSKLYPPESNHLDPMDELLKPHVHFLGAFESDKLVGCGAVKFLPEGYAEIKRMFVCPEVRGKGIGRTILNALESIVKNANITLVRLETGIRQHEAIHLYKHCGYQEIPPFGEYRRDPLSVFMEKRIGKKTERPEIEK